MKLTNKYKLPLTLAAAIKNDPYTAGNSDITTTSLILPPRIYQLKKRHFSELHEDISDNIYRLLGQNTHSILERVNISDCVIEKRYYADICGWKVGGQIDLYEKLTKVLSDWKVTSVWSVMNGLKPEHKQQLNINAYLMRLKGISPAKLQIVNFLRDWSKHKIKDYGYPKCQVVVQAVPLWNDEKTKSWIEDRIKLHQSCENMPDDQLPACTERERWDKPTVYAVMKKGRKSSLRNLNTAEEASKWMDKNKKGDNVEIRPGERTRCEHYCNVNTYCSIYMGL